VNVLARRFLALDLRRAARSAARRLWHPGCADVRVTIVGSCFGSFLRRALDDLTGPGAGRFPAYLKYRTHTVWQRVDAVVDLLEGRVPDHALVRHYIAHGRWEAGDPRYARWFAREILREGRKAVRVGGDRPDLLIFDSLSDWMHRLYRHRQEGWKCFLGRIRFDQPDVAAQFAGDFEFIELLEPGEAARCMLRIVDYFRARNANLRTVYIHFPAPAGHLAQRWLDRDLALREAVARAGDRLGPRDFLQVVVPPEKVRPITDPAHPDYSPQVWNHFHAEAYEHCARRILEWRAR
jgi:hypothetical protein